MGAGNICARRTEPAFVVRHVGPYAKCWQDVSQTRQLRCRSINMYAVFTHSFDNHPHRAGVPRLEHGSNHGEPAPLTLASRCGSVGPLLRPGRCTTTPDPSGETTKRGVLSPNTLWVSSRRPLSKCPTNNRHTTTTMATSQHDREPGRAHNENTTGRHGSQRRTAVQEQQQRGPWADRQTIHDATTPAAPVDQLSQEGGKKWGGLIRFDPQESSSTTDSAEQDMWSNFRQITTRPTHTRGGTTIEMRRSR